MTTTMKKGLLKRLIAGIVLCCILISELVIAIPVMAADVTGLSLSLNQYTSDLVIYNYLCYTSGTGAMQTGSGASYYTLKDTSNVNISVGDQENAGGDSHPMDKDIQLKFEGLRLSSGKAMTVSPVYSGKRSVRIEVTSASSLGTLVIKNGAKLVITLKAALTISNLVLEEGGSLEVLTNSQTLTLSSVTGNGSATVSGNGRLNCQNVAVGTLTLNNVTVDGQNTGRLTAEGDIAVNGATLQNLALFGYDETATGHKTISFNGGYFTNVAVVGAGSNTGAIVSLKGIETISSSFDTSYVYDYSITYMAGDTALTPQSSWPVAYRVEHDALTNAKTRVLGYVSESLFTPCATVVLPSYGTAFFGYDGWELDGAKITELPATQTGEVLLEAVLEPGTVTVELMLGYTPDTSTNDLPLPNTSYTTTSSIGSAIALSTPTRFGYVFKGWKITSGSLHGTYSGTYTIAGDDLDTADSSDIFMLTMVAVWEEDRFPIRLMIGTLIEPETLRISVDGGASWEDLLSFVEHLPANVTYANRMFSFSDYIVYGETLEDYFTRVFGSYPLLKDRTNVYTFAAWYNSGNGVVVSQNEAYRYGEGFLNRSAGVATLVEGQGLLKEAPIGLVPLWIETTYEYTLTINGKSDWSVLVNGSLKTPDANGQIKVQLGSKVSLARPIDSSKTLSYWSLTNVSQVTERVYAAGAQYLYYDFDMPANDVVATCRNKNDTSDGDQLYIDLAQSPITFAENVSYNGRAHNGFYYNVKIDGMLPLFRDAQKGYFYIWDSSEPFHVTTYGAPTQNRLTLVNHLAGGVYITNCNLVATDDYLSDAVGARLNGTLMEAGKSGAPAGLSGALDWSSYGNIVLDNNLHPSYTTNLYIRGTNTIACIIPSNAYTASAYAGTLNITGASKTSSFLTLGSVTCMGVLNVKNLTVNEYNDNYSYLFYTLTAQMNCDNLDISDCIVNAHTKRLYNSFNYLNVRNTTLDVGSVFVAYSLRLYGSSYVRVRGDVVCYYYLIDVNGSSSLVVDGGVYTMSHAQAYGNGTIATSGYVIVKGLGIVGTGLNVSGNAVIVANMITANRDASFGNGVIVTNFISNPVTRVPALSGDSYAITAYTSGNASGSDQYPFYNYSNKRQVVSSVTFTGSKVCLFGYYKGSAGVYDVTNNLIDDQDNPVKAISDLLLDANGDLIAAYKTSSNRNTVATQAKAKIEELIAQGLYTDNECVATGDSSHTATSMYAKSIRITGGEIYSVGNVNFFNDTTVSGGKIVCGGRFGSRRDLTISGGEIIAREVGISYNRTTQENGLERYSLLTLAGGTITTDRIGTHSVAPNGVTAKGVILMEITSTLLPYQAAVITINGNLLANYLYDSNVFQKEAGNPESLDFSGTYTDGVIGNIELANEVILVNPTLKGGGAAMWLYDSPNGEMIAGISAQGLVNGDEALGYYVYVDRLAFSLYAAKGEYSLKIDGDYQNTGFEVVYDGSSYRENTSFNVAAGGIVTVKLDNSVLFDRTVIWYQDAAGVWHNVCKMSGATVDQNMNTITFRMPYADVEIWISTEFTLYLDEYSISFTEKGFALAEASVNRREDALFDYAGNIRIAQKSSAKTYNRIFFENARSGNVTTGRTITLYQLRQDTLGTLHGIVLADGAQVVFTVDHANGNKVVIAPVEVPFNASIAFVGAKGSSQKSNLSFYSYLTLNNYTCVGGSTAGTVLYRDLVLSIEGSSFAQFARSLNKSSNTVTFLRCDITRSGYYTYDTIAYNMSEVILEDCNVKIYGSPDLSNTFVVGCTNLTFVNSSLEYSFGGTRGGKHPFESVSGKVTVENSSIYVYYNRTASSSTTNLESPGLYGNLVITGTSSLRLPQRISFKSIVMSGNSVMNVHNGEGYLLCPDISITENATLIAGYVIVSGFVVSSSYEDKQGVLGALAGSSSINGAQYKGLSMSGGAMNVKYFVGGDKNAKININGGALTTAALGTYGSYFGYGRYIPNNTESEFIYLYGLVPQKGTVVNISGGVVTITDGGYVGGMYATVNLTGGRILLADGATLGMTEAHKTTVYNNASEQGKLQELVDVVLVTVSGGSVEGEQISAPYGRVTVNGATPAIQVKRLASESGTIRITEADAENFENPYTGTKDHLKVGISISESLEALYVYIADGAIVYAETAYTNAKVGDSGVLLVSDGAHLYVGSEYGSRGDGDSNISELDGTIHGNKRYYIHYVLGGDSIDPAYNDEKNPAYYIFGGEDVYLYPPTRSGYDFGGWYMDSDWSGEPFEYIAAGADMNRVVYAKWIPKKVTIVVQFYADEANGLSPEQLWEETIGFGIEGTMSGSVFTFAQTVEFSYLELIYGADDGCIVIDNYSIRSYKADTLSFAQTGELMLPGQKVTKAMLEQGTVYMYVSSWSNTSKSFALNLNLSAGLPLYAQFNYVSDPYAVYPDRIESYITFGLTLGDGNGFSANGDLIRPSAPGYIFGGWYTDPSCSGEAVGSDYQITNTSPRVFYAKWIANEYYAVFDADFNNSLDEYNKITVDSTQPLAENGHHKLIVYIGYDQPLSNAKYYYSVTNGVHEELVEITDLSVLPTAWAQGYTHRNAWYYVDKNGINKEITLSTKFNATEIQIDDWTSKCAAMVDGELITAVTFYPVLERTKIVYDTNGGTIVGIDDPNAEWKQNYGSIVQTSGKAGVYTMQTANYKTALLGYTAGVAESSDYTLINTTTCMHGIQYSVVSTNAAYYSANGYCPDDYRFEIGNKGYTFRGWRVMTVDVGGALVPKTDAQGQELYLGYFPQYGDVTVQAVWEANTYQILLKPYDPSMQYESRFHEVSPISVGTLTVGQEITGLPSWPTREAGSAWYAYNADIDDAVSDEQKRYLLGFTFDPLDPGNTQPDDPEGYAVYRNYSVYITTLLTDDYEDDDSDDIYVYSHSSRSTPGTIFRLPGDSEYSSAKISEINAVPDYPNGSEIDMYAVYRERSLVFTEYYRDGAGNVNKRFLSSYPWESWSNYPIDPNGYAVDKNAAVLNERNGYYLYAWLVNGTTIGAAEIYPGSLGNLSNDAARQEYDNRVAIYKEQAENLGTYDIVVYTAYIARDEQMGTLNLTASTNPLAPYGTVAQYTLPGSMQEGTMTYTIDQLTAGLTFVKTDAELAEILYDSRQSNNKVAIKATLYDNNGLYRGSQWLHSDGVEQDLFDVSVTGGWRITFQLYHSSVITELNQYSFRLTIGFESEVLAGEVDPLENQMIIFSNSEINMAPAV